MENKPEDKSSKCCEINWPYFPIKAHYFFVFGGMAGTVPYMQVFAKDFGISPTAVGIIFSIVPVFIFLSKPAFGFITDKLRNISAVLMVVLAATALSYFAILYIPPIKNRKVESLDVSAVCREPGNELTITPPKYDSACAKEITDKQFACKLTSSDCLNRTIRGILNVTSVLPGNNNASLSFTLLLHEEYISEFDCDCLEHNISSLTCESNFYICNAFNGKLPSEYQMYNFWIFLLLSILGGAGAAIVFSLTDAACYEILSGDSSVYGKQRLWGTLSWGIATLSTGYLNDVATGDSKDRDYSPGFYLMLAFAAVDVLILFKLRLQKANMSLSICKDIGVIFSSGKPVVFAVGVFISGALSGLLWTFQFWFLTELGSTQLLLGLVAAVQCLLSEVPSFFFSGRLIKKFGHFPCLITVFAAFALRIGLYPLVKNPWLVLPIELLHGITYGIFYATTTSYAIDNAPPGTEATMIGILGGIYEGLGVGVGSFLGGFGFQYMGGNWTFFIASMISLCCVPIFAVIYKIL